MSFLLDALSGVGYALDTPGSLLRGLLAGKPGHRVGGRELLEDWGALGENQPGLDVGDALGFGAEVLLDPLNLVGAGLIGKAAKGARGISGFNKAAGAKNLAIDLARTKADDIARAATQRELLGRSHAGIQALEHPGSLVEKLPGLTEAEYNRFLYGTRNDAAEMVAKSQGVEILPPHPLASAAAKSSGEFSSYGMVPTTTRKEMGDYITSLTTAGFVPSARPDVVFTPAMSPMPTTMELVGHESLHSLAAQYPELWSPVAKALEKEVNRSIGSKRLGGELFADLDVLTKGPAVSREENIATFLGEALKRGASRQRWPMADLIAGGIDPSMAAGDISQLMREARPAIGQEFPQGLADLMSQFLSGKLRRSRALVPVGGVHGEDIARSFATESLTPLEQALLQSQYMEPLAAPHRSNLPLALMGYNAGMAPYRAN